MIKCNAVNFSYDSLVLKNASIHIQEGEFVAFIGPNGGGKTTLLKLILGFLTPEKGTIEVGSNKIGYVPQSLNYDTQFPITVIEVVMQGLLHKLSWAGKFSRAEIEQAKRALKTVHLEKFSGNSYATLSGGQRKRVLIARAIVDNPKILILDEAKAEVDPESCAEIDRILLSQKGKMTILMVTHDLHSAINNTTQVICVQGTTNSLPPDKVCEHFAMGLYHKPLMGDY